MKKRGEEAHFAQFWCNVSPFRINTCKSVSKQRTLTPFRMNTYEKQGEGGTLVAVSSHPVLRKSKTIPEERRCRVPHARSGEHAIFLLFLDCKPHPLGVGSSQPYPFPTQLPLPNSLEARPISEHIGSMHLEEETRHVNGEHRHLSSTD